MPWIRGVIVLGLAGSIPGIMALPGGPRPAAVQLNARASVFESEAGTSPARRHHEDVERAANDVLSQRSWKPLKDAAPKLTAPGLPEIAPMSGQEQEEPILQHSLQEPSQSSGDVEIDPEAGIGNCPRGCSCNSKVPLCARTSTADEPDRVTKMPINPNADTGDTSTQPMSLSEEELESLAEASPLVQGNLPLVERASEKSSFDSPPYRDRARENREEKKDGADQPTDDPTMKQEDQSTELGPKIAISIPSLWPFLEPKGRNGNMETRNIPHTIVPLPNRTRLIESLRKHRHDSKLKNRPRPGGPVDVPKHKTKTKGTPASQPYGQKRPIGKMEETLEKMKGGRVESTNTPEQVKAAEPTKAAAPAQSAEPKEKRADQGLELNAMDANPSPPETSDPEIEPEIQAAYIDNGIPTLDTRSDQSHVINDQSVEDEPGTPITVHIRGDEGETLEDQS